ncbi:glycoside hydrolase family 88 protein [Paenibacillus urinalis]|uniref:Glycoside hydrolase family 88 protein n=1 Tax=Paenibacillus urinalis TaxID=521520 RepID=A0AAX3N5E9_9BACL|nr:MULTISPECIES: glycoside hydrolase family 88 protein [Paenibacillus]WDH84229.1 glycoside hydrolase family 88 protein [Paenibacillus urinalis]WDH95672.1 glycoside hydrolase family 88 protein [Paenibacillus urinalis]WDI03869.1 glycoside hydrolase family 88 protein [Paenibacillus urinalis]GAK38786.1 unsaturated glucuronyl hydrolase [Paenibacillus sp. TCA20]
MDIIWSTRILDSFMNRNKQLPWGDFHSRLHWNYENGCMMTAVERVWRATNDPIYFDYLKTNMDLFIQDDGHIHTYRLNEYNVDQLNQGKTLFTLYEEMGDEKYRIAIEHLMTQLRSHPRTAEGGLWHKKIYPFQMWLDGVYMACPLMTAYADLIGANEWFDEAVHEILLMEKVSRDPETGLLYHAYDESREQAWADSITGCSPHFWGRALGWYVMAITDVLDTLPLDHPKRGQVIGIFYRVCEAIMKVQDEATGLWYQVLNLPEQEGNYLEASASSMFVCALAKGARLGYLGSHALEAARRGHEGIVRQFVKAREDGSYALEGICKVAGLGGQPYRDGSFEYYIGEPQRTDDPKGLAPFVMACLELEAQLTEITV